MQAQTKQVCMKVCCRAQRISRIVRFDDVCVCVCVLKGLRHLVPHHAE